MLFDWCIPWISKLDLTNVCAGQLILGHLLIPSRNSLKMKESGSVRWKPADLELAPIWLILKVVDAAELEPAAF
jgi:hypothetical protein